MKTRPWLGIALLCGTLWSMVGGLAAGLVGGPLAAAIGGLVSGFLAMFGALIAACLCCYANQDGGTHEG
jgi:hypothetical protein